MVPSAVVILGAGPAGLGAALRLGRRGVLNVAVVEKTNIAGGNAASFEIEGLRVDYGSHRLHPSCKPEILQEIRDLLGSDLLDRPRHGRIRLRGRWVHFPLKPADLALHLPVSFMCGVLFDAATKRFRVNTEASFASVLEHGLGPTICRDFYFPYAAKIWGVPPVELAAEQAHKRVSGSSFGKMLQKVLNAVPGLKPKKGGRFFYPRHGYGQISEAYCQAARQAGVDFHFGASVVRLELDSGHAVAVHTSSASGERRFPAQQFLSTIPLPILTRIATPAAPADALSATSALRYRAMILIYLVLDTEQFTEYDAHYFPESDIPITRLSEPKNYSLATLHGMTVLCAELPCDPKERVWHASDDELGRLVFDGLGSAGLRVSCRLRRVVTRRLEQAYPIYTHDYRRHFDVLDAWAASIDGLVTFGRQGLFAHDNTHHALAMADAASDCLTDDANFDRDRWAECRLAFQSHVVED